MAANAVIEGFYLSLLFVFLEKINSKDQIKQLRP